jgi:hypothetical protein
MVESPAKFPLRSDVVGTVLLNEAPRTMRRHSSLMKKNLLERSLL